MSTANRPDPKIAIGGESPVASLRVPVVVGLVQINNSFSGQNYLPYSVALLQTYVQKMAGEPGRYAFLPSFGQYSVLVPVESLSQVVLHVVVQRHGNEDEIGVGLPPVLFEVQQLVVRPPSADAGVHDVDRCSGPLRELSLQATREGGFKRQLEGLHERVPEDENPVGPIPLADGVLSISHTCGVDRHLLAELGKIDHQARPMQRESVLVLMPYAQRLWIEEPQSKLDTRESDDDGPDAHQCVHAPRPQPRLHSWPALPSAVIRRNRLAAISALPFSFGCMVSQKYSVFVSNASNVAARSTISARSRLATSRIVLL